jgi:DNA-binding beta-propeller fold protein YncE
VSLRRIGFASVPTGAKPGFDHADVYTRPAGGRMYVAHTGADRIDVFDCERGSFLHSLDGHPGVAGVLVDSARDVMLATDRGAARLSVYRASDETRIGDVPVGPRPNAVALDTHEMRAYTFDLGEPIGVGCSSTVVDLATRAVVARIELPGRPRWAVYDASTRAVYANISDPACIVVIDTAAKKIARRIPVPSAGPHGLALVDEVLFCATDAGELVVLDLAGAVRAQLRLGGVPDVVMYDGDLGRLYVAIGTPGIVQSFDSKSLRPIETVATEEGAHTIGWDPARKQLWAFAPRSCGAIIYQESA